MAASGPSPHLSPARSSCQIAGRPIPAPRHAPAVRIRSWRRFAASGSEVSLVPARPLRFLPRRRNALREKASQPLPALVVRHQVRPPCHESPEFGSLDSQEPKSGSLDAEPSSDLDQELDISVGQSASRSRDVTSDSKLDELDVIGEAEDVPLCGTRADPAFGVYKDPDDSVMQFEVGEDEIINMSEAAGGEGSGDLESMSSRATKAINVKLERSGRVAPNSSDNSSRFHFAAAETERMGSSGLNGEDSVARRNMPPSRNVTWSGFAALCGICIVFVASKLIRRSSKAQLPRKLFDVHRPEMIEDEFGKGNLNVFRNGQDFSDGLQRRPLLDRKELMSNIKRAQTSRKWFALSNSFRHKDVATYDDTNIQEIRRNVAQVHIFKEGITQNYWSKEHNGIFIQQPIDVIEEEVSASYSSQTYLDEVSNSSESNGISLSQDKIEEIMEQTVDLKKSESNGISLSKDNIEESMEQTVDMKNSESNGISLSKDKIEGSMEHTVDLKNSKSNGISLSKDKIEENMEQTVDLKTGAQIMNMSEKNQGNIGEIELPEPSYSNERVNPTNDRNSMMICKLDKEAQIGSANVHKSGPNSARTPPSEFELKEIEAAWNSANIADTACREEFSHNMSIIGTEVSKTPVKAETRTTTSPQRSREDPTDLRIDNLQSMQEIESSISSGPVEQPCHGTENEHKERIVHNKSQTGMETDHIGMLNNAGRPSFCTLQEETVQDTLAEVSRSEKKQGKRKPKAHLPKKKGKLQMYSDKETETEQLEQGKPGIETVVNPTNCVQKTKTVPKKRQKKVRNEMRVPALDDVQCSSMVVQKNNNQHAKRGRRKNPKNAFHNQGAQTREENPETAHVINSPDTARIDNMKPLAVADSSMETQPSKDAFGEDQPNGSSPSTIRKEELEAQFLNPGKGGDS